jgi:hypothetical protein
MGGDAVYLVPELHQLARSSGFEPILERLPSSQKSFPALIVCQLLISPRTSEFYFQIQYYLVTGQKEMKLHSHCTYPLNVFTFSS